MNEIKKQFKIFENYRQENNKAELIYLDSASSSLTPDIVIEKMNEYYFKYRSNIDRAISKIAIRATNEYNESRKILAKYLNCDEEEIIWTNGATNSSNLLIDMLAKHDDEYNFLNKNDEILTTILEHHSSLVPLQELAKKKNMRLRFLELNQNFELDFSKLKDLVNEKTKIVSICLVSNVIGQVNDIKKIIAEIKKINKNIFIICDMTAAFGHFKIDLKDLRNYIDATYFSFHKSFGPTGVGGLFIKRELSRNMTPTIFGGGMIAHVEKEKSEYRSDIKVFEAGTGNIAGVIGAGEAIKFIEKIAINENSKENIFDHNKNLVKYFFEKIEKLNQDLENKNKNKNLEINIFTKNYERNIGIISFQIFVDEQEIHPHDVADILSGKNISVRAGHHCAEPLMNYLNLKNGLTRISFHIYNDETDIDNLIESFLEIKKVFEKKIEKR